MVDHVAGWTVAPLLRRLRRLGCPTGPVLLLPFMLGSMGCDDPTAVPLAAVRIEMREVWSGADLHVVSQGFNARPLPSVSLDSVALPVQRIDDSTVSVTVPPRSGVHTLSVRSTYTEPFSVTLTVYGFSDAAQDYPALCADSYVWPRIGHASVLGVTDAGLTLIEVDTKSVTVFDSIFDPQRCWNSLRGPGATYRDSVFLVLPINGGTVESWRLLPNPGLVARHDIVPDRQVMQLGPDTWLMSSHHVLWTQTRPDSSQPYREVWLAQVEETEGVFMSPRKDRATVTADHAFGGLPVFDVPSGSLAYRVTSLEGAAGVDFSADGELLAVVGGTTWVDASDGRVLLLRAATGEVLADTTLGVPVFGVAIDPARPWLYVGATRQGSPAVVVLERDTFRELATLEVPADAPTCGGLGFCYHGVIALSDEPALYVVWGWERSTIAWRFTLPPASGTVMH